MSSVNVPMLLNLLKVVCNVYCWNTVNKVHSAYSIHTHC
jgi:hypothetical protein